MKQNLTKLSFAASLLLAGGLLATVTGCQYNSTKPLGDQEGFDPNTETSPVRIYENNQIKNYAVKDGVLYDYHFDGEYLNSLGAQKLHYMATASDHAFPLIVYLDVPDDKARASRQQAVVACLKDAGLHDDQFKFEYGPNPNMTSPVAPNLRRLGKTEDLSPVGGTSPVDQGGSAATAPPAGSNGNGQ